MATARSLRSGEAGHTIGANIEPEDRGPRGRVAVAALGGKDGACLSPTVIARADRPRA